MAGYGHGYGKGKEHENVTNPLYKSNFRTIKSQPHIEYGQGFDNSPPLGHYGQHNAFPRPFGNFYPNPPLGNYGQVFGQGGHAQPPNDLPDCNEILNII